MPQYPWICRKCGIELEIIRHFSKYEEPPTEEETGPTDCEHDWERLIAAGTKVLRGDGWGRHKRKD